MAKIREALRAGGMAAEGDAAHGCLIVDVESGQHPLLARRLDGALSRAEARDSRVLFMTRGGQPGFAEMSAVDSLETYIARELGGWLLDLMRDGRITTLFQPIVYGADPASIFAHECLLRGVGADGAPISPGQIFDVAGRADLIFPLDRLARTTAVANAAARGVPGHIFINFTPSSIYDPDYCLRTTLAAVEKAGLDRDRIVFEVIETERIGDPAHLAGVLRYYRDAGFKVALDDLGGGYASLGLLPSLRPHFIKLDRALVDGVCDDPVKAVIIARLVEMAHDLEIGVVAEGVERPQDLAWLREHAVDYIQGFLLARPAPEPVQGRLSWGGGGAAAG
ncbi:EAL domain-containing protein [uncultured Rhodospira sp.]|uniref:EAL domain-containing protein n=1 Tax=uncultured Rhodospira sp. TaxID=1936189 RepID=UPI00260D56BA|nr:EAL domain-containing protein [uncultured Rhodospira sp.]